MTLKTAYQDIRTNNEDFVLTPFISLISANLTNDRIIGLAITWFYYSFMFGVKFKK